MTLLNQMGYTFKNPDLLELALTHKSFHNENVATITGNNERLEFLGDAVLDLVVSEILMKRFPTLSEGDLSKMRASLVNESVLAESAKELGLDRELRLGKGEVLTGGAQKPRLLASGMEALIGACYLDGGYDSVFYWLEIHLENKINNLDLNLHFATDYKTRLQEWAQQKEKTTPYYEVLSETGPDHEKIFLVEVRLGNRVLGTGRGKNKKSAEQEAARLYIESQLCLEKK